MPINFPANRSEVVNRARTDVQGEFSESNPFLRNFFVDALTVGYAGRIYEFYLQLKSFVLDLFPDTASGTFLARWGSYVSITRNAATQATGFITVVGTAGSSIPVDTQLRNPNGVVYSTNTSATITAQSIVINSITRVGTTATATTSSEHLLASNISVTISGADQSAYNGAKTITVTAANTFTFDVSGSPTTPATGSMLASYSTASISVTSVEFGQDTNSDSGTILTLTSPISGVNNSAYVQFGAIGGGSDLESDQDFRERILFRYQNPVSLFNSVAIELKAKEVSGVTRVFVQQITPDVGQVTVYFVRDNDANIIPSGTEISSVKNKILEIKPANTSDTDVIVLAPTAVNVDFSFSALSPNTSTMQRSIINNLTALFRDGTNVGEDLLSYAYLGTIYQTVDEETGSRVESFTLSSPSGDVSIAAGEIPILGTVSF